MWLIVLTFSVMLVGFLLFLCILVSVYIVVCYVDLYHILLPLHYLGGLYKMLDRMLYCVLYSVLKIAWVCPEYFCIDPCVILDPLWFISFNCCCCFISFINNCLHTFCGFDWYWYLYSSIPRMFESLRAFLRWRWKIRYS